MAYLRLLQKGKLILIFSIESFYRTSVGLKEKTNLSEVLTSVKLVRYFRHHFELKSISLKFRQQCFSIITFTVIMIEILLDTMWYTVLPQMGL